MAEPEARRGSLEQGAVHPRAKVEVGEEVVQARLDEEAAAVKVIAALAGLDVDSDDFVAGFTKLCADVVAHAENEEHLDVQQAVRRLHRGSHGSDQRRGCVGPGRSQRQRS